MYIPQLFIHWLEFVLFFYVIYYNEECNWNTYFLNIFNLTRAMPHTSFFLSGFQQKKKQV